MTVSGVPTTIRRKLLPLSRGRTNLYPQVTATTATTVTTPKTSHTLGLCHPLPPTATYAARQLPLPHTYGCGSSGSTAVAVTSNQPERPPQ